MRCGTSVDGGAQPVGNLSSYLLSSLDPSQARRSASPVIATILWPTSARWMAMIPWRVLP